MVAPMSKVPPAIRPEYRIWDGDSAACLLFVLGWWRVDRNGPSKSPEARVLRDRDGDDGGPAVKAVAQTEMERGERG